MGPPALLDENLEHEVLHRLQMFGHAVEYLGFLNERGKEAEVQTVESYFRSTLGFE